MTCALGSTSINIPIQLAIQTNEINK